MTDTNQTPPDWILIEAAKRSELTHHIDFLRDFYRDSRTFRALCDMIAKHEQPPVDRKLLCAREALRLGNEGAFRDGNGNWTPEQEMVRAIELWESGYGKD